MAVSESDVNTTKSFTKVPLIDKPVQTIKSSPPLKQNLFTGLPLRGASAQKHHTVPEAPDTVTEAVEQGR